MAYVLDAQQMGDHGMAGVLDTIPVSPRAGPISPRSGWSANEGCIGSALSRARDQNTGPVQRQRAHAYEA
ncbi:MAG: hypothetical protein ACRDTH_18455 [Pseudonocardiaceae bacterium]